MFPNRGISGGSNENPTVEQVSLNAMALAQQQGIYQGLKTMNVEQGSSPVRVLHGKPSQLANARILSPIPTFIYPTIPPK